MWCHYIKRTQVFIYIICVYIILAYSYIPVDAPNITQNPTRIAYCGQNGKTILAIPDTIIVPPTNMMEFEQGMCATNPAARRPTMLEIPIIDMRKAASPLDMDIA